MYVLILRNNIIQVDLLLELNKDESSLSTNPFFFGFFFFIINEKYNTNHLSFLLRVRTKEEHDESFRLLKL